MGTPGWVVMAGRDPWAGVCGRQGPLAPEQIKAWGIYLPAGPGTPALSEGAFHPY